MRRRRAAVVGTSFVAFVMLIALSPVLFRDFIHDSFAGLVDRFAPAQTQDTAAQGVYEKLESLEVKGRAPKTGYARTEFGNGWAKVQGCSTREIILHRDVTNIVMKNECQVQSGMLDDPYTGEQISFHRDNARAVQIDHVVALSDAWQKGAQLLTTERRKELANDPLNLLASDGPANQQKGDSDAASWVPKNKAFRCQYIERQIEVKHKYTLWVTLSEKAAMQNVLRTC